MPPSRAMHPAIQAAFFVERYAVYDEFAAGGMATVHFARLNGAQGFRRTVAVKRLLPHLTRDHDFALMLIDEARLASRVRHHNVVATLDVVQTADELLLVMEYVHGESLAKLARWSAERHEAIPVAIAAAIVCDALHGLHAAHEAKDEQGAALGLVHRDVSPQNVLVGLDGITRIADFGVAKAAGRVQSTRDGAIKGKLAYMAPEQISGSEVSRVSDVFAAAIVLWEVLTAERLFAGANQAETVFKVMSAPIPRPSTRRPGLSQALDEIVLRGLERDPALRYQTAQEMALALERAAPSVRPSEIASWVERVVADRLAPRGRILSAIEGSAEAPEIETGTHRKDHVSPLARTEYAAGERSGISSSRAPRGTQHKAQRRMLIGSSFVALLSLLGVATWTLLQRLAPVSSPAFLPASLPAFPNRAPDVEVRAREQDKLEIVAPSNSMVSASASALPTSELAAPELAAPELATSALAASLVDAAVSAHDLNVQTKTGTTAPSSKHRVRSAHGRSGHACDPPYAIDSAGRKLFKVECM